jgi:hypothetical protein
LHGFGLVLDFNERAEIGSERPCDEQLELVRRLQLFLVVLRRGGEFKNIALNAQGQAIDEGLANTVLFEALGQPPRSSRAGDLKTHHMHLLTEAVQARRACVAGVALHVVLACEGWDRISRRDIQRCKDNHDQGQTAEHTPGHGSPSIGRQQLALERRIRSKTESGQPLNQQ